LFSLFRKVELSYWWFFSDVFTWEDALFHGLPFRIIKFVGDLQFYVSQIEIFEKMKSFLVRKCLIEFVFLHILMSVEGRQLYGLIEEAMLFLLVLAIIIAMIEIINLLVLISVYYITQHEMVWPSSDFGFSNNFLKGFTLRPLNQKFFSSQILIFYLVLWWILS
jgi:hypothetical protein